MTLSTPPAVLAPNARLEKIIAEMRAEARDASADGEDMSVMRGWANDLAKLARSLAQQQAAPAGEVWNDVLGELNEAYMRGQLGEDPQTIAAMERIRFLLAQQQAAPAGADEAMVERAFAEMRQFDCFFIFGNDRLRGLIRGWLTAALTKEPSSV
jgi:hypothetical protein